MISGDSCIQGDGIQPMELGDQEEQLKDGITESEVVMSSGMELVLRTPSGANEVQDLCC